jgi:hypothetical protein
LGDYRECICLIKNSIRKTQWEKTVLGEKSTYQPHFVLHMLPRQKPYVRNLQVKTHKGEKEYNIKPSWLYNYIVTILRE